MLTWTPREVQGKRPIMTIPVTQSHFRYLEGQGDLVSRLITPKTHVVTLNISTINLLPTESPPSTQHAVYMSPPHKDQPTDVSARVARFAV